eukprot:XP_011661621.1 PREDICTED: uncharacterized protein LOC105437088 [Strongylocentrotus purpuratus]
MKTMIFIALFFVGLASGAIDVSGDTCIEDDPCKYSVCRMAPRGGTTCSGTCEGGVVWMDNRGDVIDCDTCGSTETVSCAADMCANASCLGREDPPRCRVFNCGHCVPEFFNFGSNDPVCLGALQE